MIDYIKLKANNKSSFEERIKSLNDLDMRCSYGFHTGEPLYPCRAFYKNLKINITEKNAYLENSLHKYYNISNGLENQNHNDFYYSDLVKAISFLEKEFKINISDFSLVPLEFGINIETNINPTQIINQNLFLYDFKDFNHSKVYKGQNSYKQFAKTDCIIKIYDKGFQYNTGNNILRFEIKFLRSRLLNRNRVFKVKDILNKTVLKQLFDFLQSEFDKLLIIDGLIAGNNLTKEEINYIKLGRSSAYWEEVKREKSSSQYGNLKRDFKTFLKDKELTTIKEELLQNLELKFNQLLEIKEDKLVA